MKKIPAPCRGIAAEVVILIVALAGGAGWFGVREIKHAVVQHDQDRAAQELTVRQAAADAAAKAAAEERSKAEQARAEAEAKRVEERTRQVNTGRAIQRASTQGAIVIGQLPDSLERSLLSDRILEIDTASSQLFGAPETADIASWKKLATDALAGQAAAQAKLADQIRQVRQLAADLKTAQEARKKAEDEAKTADVKATAAQQKFDSAYAQTKVAVHDMVKAVADGDSLRSLALGLKLILFAVAGIWILGLLLKIFAIGVPEGTPLANVLHTSANTFHSILAPMAVVAEAHAKREKNRLVQSAGTFIADLRQKMPEVATQVTNLMDVTLAPEHQQQIHAAHLEVRREQAASAIAAAVAAG